MAELKRNFGRGQMNKDSDERLVKDGTYRDANNIQVSSSDGSDVGSVQTLLGNTEVTPNVVLSDYSTCVGVYKLPESDLIYYLVSSQGHPGLQGFQPLIYKDFVIEYDTVTQLSKYVITDIFKIKVNASANAQSGASYIEVPLGASTTINKTGIRVGMKITGSFTNSSGSSKTIVGQTVGNNGTYYVGEHHNVKVTDIVKATSSWKIFLSSPIYMNSGQQIIFRSDRVLEFNPYDKITSIDHIDGLLFWTDNVTEPKKINIKRSLLGTGGIARVVGHDPTQTKTHATNQSNQQKRNTTGYTNNQDFHTRLVIERPSTGYEVALKQNDYEPVYLEKDHITVVKKYPKAPLKLEMSETPIERVPVNSSGNALTPNATFGVLSSTIVWRENGGSGDPYDAGTAVNGLVFTSPVDLRKGDVVIFTNDLQEPANVLDSTDALVRLTVTSGPGGMPQNGGSTGPYNFSVDSVATNVNTVPEVWQGRLETENALFEFKFPRFSYRWRYVDGEYSTFAPWTNVAFLPGAFDYIAKKGVNLGMTNRAKSIKLKDYFHEFDLFPSDVVAVDLLYKEETSPNVYTVKTITRENEHPEWPNRAQSNYNRGEYVLTSEMIHAVVPSNQILRPWDNVPKSAATLAITGNRLVFGNYKQGYDIEGDVNLTVSMDSGYGENYLQEGGRGERSVKTMRTYQVGIVFSDEYGRETPVQAPKKSSSVVVDKKLSYRNNRIKVGLDYGGTSIPAWAQYYKYYIKETSNEYYNLVMDRWYDAEDGNVWISFPSSERNKVDIDTHLILKKRHDDITPVREKARYKILAIENEAPDYIKSKKISHGSALTTQQTGSVLATNVNFLISNNDFKATFGDKFMEEVWSKVSSGKGFARIIGSSGTQTATTDWQSIVSIKKIGATSPNFSVRVASTFENADMTNLLSGTINYKIEIREDIIHNRPEFDGRFFVKVYKDLLLQNSIMVDLDATQSMTLIDSFDLRLLIGAQSSNSGGSTQYHPTTTGPYAGLDFNENAFAGTNVNSLTSTNQDGESFGTFKSHQRLQDWWKNLCAHGQSKVYLDGIEWYKYNWRSPTGHVNHNEANGVHSSHLGGIGDGNGVLKHYSSYSKMYLGFPKWRQHHSATGWVRRFYTTMRTVGTLFRFREDPNQTVYRVISVGGVQQSYNYSKSGTNSAKSNDVQAKSTAFNINFERNDGGGAMDPNAFDVLSLMKHDCSSTTPLDILQADYVSESGGSELATENPAVWETEPKEDVGLDIYYEASMAMPLKVTAENNELLIPIGSTFKARNGSGVFHKGTSTLPVDLTGEDVTYKILAVNSTDNEDITRITVYNTLDGSMGLTDDLEHDSFIFIDRYDGSQIPIYIGINNTNNKHVAGDVYVDLVTGNFPQNVVSNGMQPWRAPHFSPMKLGWSNCFQFGNGIESDRIRDDYNQSTIANGVKASTVLAERYQEEHRSNGFIHSGVFNSISGVNDLNQFIQAEAITKDLNPSYGSIQHMIARNTNTLAFCEDKILSIQTNKDALFNADGSSNILSSTVVLGSATPIQGEYGISTNPESVAITPEAIYWCDQARNQVLKLSGQASITVISDTGMKDYFNDNLKDLDYVIGSYDDKKSEYNLTTCVKIHKFQLRPITKTVSYSEKSGGWSSFKDFDGLEFGVSLNNEYYTFRYGSMWQHHTNNVANNFYNQQYYSDITLLFNDNPSSVKSFGALNYEGTQARITQELTDNQYYNLNNKQGWYVETMNTDLQEAENIEFKNKEGKWFATVKGVASDLSNLDPKEFSVQGIGVYDAKSSSGSTSNTYNLTVAVRSQSSTGTNWDTTADSSDFAFLDGPTIVMTEGVPTGVGQVYATITNNVLNSQNVLQYSGLNLDAADFTVPGGTATTTGSGNSTVYVHTAASGWNADTNISKVELTNNGIAGDAGNTVNVQIYYNSFTMPSANTNLFVDVDYSGSVTAPIVQGAPNRTSLFRLSFLDAPTTTGEGATNPDHIVVTRGTVANMTRTADNGYAGGSNPNFFTDKHTGVVPDGATTLVASYTVTADADYHLEPISGSNDGVEVVWYPLPQNINYSSNYSWVVTNNNYTTSGLQSNIQSSNIEVYYTPPAGSDPADFDSLLHDIRFTHNAVAVPNSTPRVTSVGMLGQVFAGGQQVIPITTNSVGHYRLQVGKNNSGNTALTGTYNFTSGAWEFSNTTNVGSFEVTAADLAVSSVYQQTLYIPIDSNETNAGGTYSIILSNGNSGSGTNLALQSNVPDAVNEQTFEVLVETGTITLTGGTETFDDGVVTTSGSTVIPSAKELTQLSSTNVKTYAVELTFAKQTGGLTKKGDANGDMLDGAGGVYKTASDMASGTQNLTLTRVTGIKVGHVLQNDTGQGFIPDGSIVTSVNTVTKVIGISKATTALVPQGSSVVIESDYSYIFLESATLVNEAGTQATVTGTIAITSYGRKGSATVPNGNITLKPNFLTIT